MELHHLRYFVAIADAVSFSRAAESLDISQPALSRQMRDLEHELGAPLFNREGRRISLTEAGRSLLQPARASLAEAERGRRSVREVVEAHRGSLTIGSSPQTAATVLAPVLSGFAGRYPLAMVRVIEDGAGALIAGLEDGNLDLAVVPLDVPATIAVRPFLTAHILAVGHRGNPLVAAERIDLRDLVAPRDAVAIPLLLLKEQYLTRVRLTAAWHEAGLVPYVAMESAVGQTLAAYAEARLGIALLPETVDLRGFDLGKAVVCDHGEPIVLKNGIGWNPGRYQSPLAVSLVEDICASARTRRAPQASMARPIAAG